MIVAEVEPIGGFVGGSLSEPLLQAGILLSVLAYILHLDRWMAASAFALFVPQLFFVPLMQHAINRRAGARVWVLRQLGISTADTADTTAEHDRSDSRRVDRVLRLNMGIYKLKFSMNFLMGRSRQLFQGFQCFPSKVPAARRHREPAHRAPVDGPDRSR